MAKKAQEKPIKDLRFYQFANWLWEDGSRLKEIREELGLTKKEFAKRAKIAGRVLNGYERSGGMAGNFWLFCAGLEHVVIRDPDDWEKFLEDEDDRMKGGPIGKRDNRYGKPKKFWRWSEDEKKDEMSRRTGEDIPREDVERWYKEWLRKGKPDGWGREESRPMK